jgi:ATPase subunit of ABC transporter with duplicated ATPase domains
MFIVKNISKSIGSKTLFEKISFSIAPGERVALVGQNGVGKSTFLKILAGIEDLDSGSFAMQKERVAYVSQELITLNRGTIGAYLGGREDEMTHVLEKVGLESVLLSNPVCELSGGQKTRVMIARALLASPTVLLLDEPTNHLDKEGLAWFREFLRTFRGIAFIVSHDRELLEDMNRIFEIRPGEESLDIYIGGWTSYKKQKSERMMERKDAYNEQQKEKKRLEEYLKWRQAQASSRSNPVLGAQVRMIKKRIEKEIVDQEIKRPKDSKTISGVSLTGATHSSKLLLAFREISFALGEKRIFYKTSFEIRGRERVLLSGENGSGKSTLLKIVMEELQAQNGEVKIGTNVHIGYFAQEHEMLNPKETVLESFENTERLRKNGRDSRGILASFLFVDNELDKEIKDLSPGERVRLIFAKLVHQENELLLLDEPTNHLDIQSKEAIEEALQSFEGGILFVSHDRYFRDAINTTRELVIENGKLREILS